MKGSHLAHCDTVTLVTQLDAAEPQTQETAALCKQLWDVIATFRTNSSNAETQELEELITKDKDGFVMKSIDYGQTNKVYHLIDAGEALLI
jgi:hypothetical protein